jgi:hypothetical protein
MEIKTLGTFNQVGRPVDTIRFQTINSKQIKYKTIGTDGLAMPVQSIVKISLDPHPDYFTALDRLAPFAIKTLDLGKHWQAVTSVGSLKLEWTYNNNTKKFTYKIAEISGARPSHISEIPIERTFKLGDIIIDDIPWEVRDAIESIMDEAWMYCTGKKSAQLNLFDNPGQTHADDALSILNQAINEASQPRRTRSKAKKEPVPA